MIKVFFDIIISFFLIIILSIPFSILVLILFIFSKGPIFFVQKRVGKNQKLFKLIKLRTMKINTKSVETHLISHEQVTQSGRIMRKFKIDEIPQLINVVSGKMSLVGPRPCLESQKKLIELRKKNNVFSVKPGVTGLAQIKNIDMSNPRFLSKIDKLYIKKMNFCFDVFILVLTLFGKGFGDNYSIK